MLLHLSLNHSIVVARTVFVLLVQAFLLVGKATIVKINSLLRDRSNGKKKILGIPRLR